LDLLIIVPIILTINLNPKEHAIIVLTAFSRYFRMINFGITLSTYYKLGSTDVER